MGKAVIVGLSVGEGLVVNWNGKKVGLGGGGVNPNSPVFISPLICSVSFHIAEPMGITTIVNKAMITNPMVETIFRLSTKRLNTSNPYRFCPQKIRLINILMPSETHPSFGMTITNLPFNWSAFQDGSVVVTLSPLVVKMVVSP